ncbi:MAG: TAXI family TRAP transporter solute-binding subunit [Burkholderiales bacterium]
MSDSTPRANAITIRSKLMLEIASELVAGPDWGLRQVKVSLREQGAPEWALSLYGSGTMESFDAVMNHRADLAICNPSASLTLAYRGHAPFKAPLPVRTIAIIPSHDQCVFAVRAETGLQSVEEIAERKCPLRVLLRGDPQHGLHAILDHIAAAAGFSLDDLRVWGGTTQLTGMMPLPDSAKFAAVVRGEADAIFDEATESWVGAAVKAGLTILPMREKTLQKLLALGFRKGILKKAIMPELPQDIASIDFSGWPVFTHADTPDTRITQICAALDARKHLMPWQGDGPMPVERMCIDALDTPIDVPFHPAAERYWRERGYLR